MFPVIAADKIKLREMTLDDADDMFCYYSNPEMMKYTSTDAHTSKEETIARIIKLSDSFQKKKGIAWAVEEKTTKKVIGDIGIYYIDSDHKKAGVGFNISQKYWNKGYGTLVLSLVLKYAINEMNIERIESTCKIENIASASVMEKSGMHFGGILRNYSYKNIMT